MIMQLYPANRGRTAVTLRDRNNNCQEGVSPAIKHTSADNRPSHAERMMIVMRGRKIGTDDAKIFNENTSE